MTHPIDHLASLRQRIVELQAEAEQIRLDVLAGKTGIIGDVYCASLRRQLVLQKLLDKAGRDS